MTSIAPVSSPQTVRGHRGRVKGLVSVQSKGQGSFCSVVKWLSSKMMLKNFLTPVLAVDMVCMGVSTP